MIYIETASEDVYYNFACEHYFLHIKKLPEPVFLLWRTSPTLMVGRYQNIAEEINRTYAEAHSLTLVRRQSGGGTIYTDEGCWQYTYILRDLTADEVDFRKNSEAVVAALNELGAKAYFNKRNDVFIGEQKVCGNARYVTDDGIVHHGSILFDCDLDAMEAALTPPEEKIISKGVKSVRQHVSNIHQHLSEDLSPEEFKARLLSLIFPGEMPVYEITEEDKREIEKYRREVFASPDFIFGKNPRFEILRKHRFDGGLLSANLCVEHGKISALSFSGDFFFDGDKDALDAYTGCLVGADYTTEGLSAALTRAAAHGQFFRITESDVLSLLLP